MEKKSVLVTYRQHNKVLCVESLDGEGDVQILEDEFRKEFKLEPATDLSITFQRFDTDWKEFINLDSSSTLYHKDKLMAFTTSLEVRIHWDKVCMHVVFHLILQQSTRH